MITALHAENFKSLQDLHLDELRRINLVSGSSGVGKSSLLEALFLYKEHVS